MTPLSSKRTTLTRRSPSPPRTKRTHSSLRLSGNGSAMSMSVRQNLQDRSPSSLVNQWRYLGEKRLTRPPFWAIWRSCSITSSSVTSLASCRSWILGHSPPFGMSLQSGLSTACRIPGTAPERLKAASAIMSACRLVTLTMQRWSSPMTSMRAAESSRALKAEAARANSGITSIPSTEYCLPHTSFHCHSFVSSLKPMFALSRMYLYCLSWCPKTPSRTVWSNLIWPPYAPCVMRLERCWRSPSIVRGSQRWIEVHFLPSPIWSLQTYALTHGLIL
mmetsp:Transcript_71311/g.153905  ORF Transcript_71311/g.153905 Transcript_71311/m.153905 type:complete len:276 (-) Transcript_71311:757-1584(-)